MIVSAVATSSLVGRLTGRQRNSLKNELHVVDTRPSLLEGHASTVVQEENCKTKQAPFQRVPEDVLAAESDTYLCRTTPA